MQIEFDYIWVVDLTIATAQFVVTMAFVRIESELDLPSPEMMYIPY